MQDLAIIIPAYKSKYFRRTLESLAQQTCTAFTIYVGNDAGDIEIESIVRTFQDRLNIIYNYFDNNIGGHSLVKQWERCFELTNGEEWFWILPDDDYIDSNCVEIFYREKNICDFDVFRFNVHFINSNDEIFKTNPPLELSQNSYDSLIEKLSFKRASTVSEYIFRKQKYDQIGFANIPLAWGADDLFWFLMGRNKGIRGTNHAYVYLRQSELNISNNYSSLAPQKIEANFMFFKYLMESREFKEISRNTTELLQFKDVALIHIISNLRDFSYSLDPFKIFKYSIKGNKIWGGGLIKNIRRFYLNNKRIK